MQYTVVPALAAISSPIILRQLKKARAAQATNNARDIYPALKDYSDNGKGLSPSANKADDSANDVLRKLFSDGYIQDESPFYVKGISGSKDPDNNTQNDEALSFGENVFAYCPNTPIIDVADRPLLISSLYEDADGTIKADAKVYEGKAIVLRADGSVVQCDVNEDGEIIYEGKNLLDNKHRVWTEGEGAPMDIRLPELGE